MASAEAFVFDLDGVIWIGGALIDGVKEALDMLRRLGKAIIFATNNSTKRRAEVAAKLRELGLEWVEERHVFSSGFAAASLLEAKGIPLGSKVYIVGEDGLVAEMSAKGFQPVGGPADAGQKTLEEVSAKIQSLTGHESDFGAVVCGLDRQLNYFKVAVASQLVRAGVPLFASNEDLYGPLGIGNQNWPGAGSVVAAVAAGSGRWPPSPDAVAGKPSKVFADMLRRELGGLAASKMVMVGDRLDTDIAFGAAAGMRTLLVLSGVTDEATARQSRGDLAPDFFAPSVAALLTA